MNPQDFARAMQGANPSLVNKAEALQAMTMQFMAQMAMDKAPAKSKTFSTTEELCGFINSGPIFVLGITTTANSFYLFYREMNDG